MKTLAVSGALRSIYDHRDLLRSLVRREIEGKYRATALGLAWVVIYPLMMVGVYTFVFAGVFGARWGDRGNWTDFVPMLYSGLLVHAIFAETVGKAPYLIVNNPNYVKKVVFPLELLPVGSLLSALFNAVVGFALLLAMALLLRHTLHWTVVFVPLVLVPLVLFTIGFAWAIAALGVFLRDLEQVIGVAMSMLLFLSPVFYSVEAAPAIAQKLLLINPLTYPIDELRHLVLLGHLPRWQPWLLNTMIAAAVAWSGLWVFERTRPAFADVV
jgi:lipopolysaccharide transport system permease protein